MPIISIVVPVYKVEQYLNKCIDSILAQTFADFELILVDDGSPDKCGEICDDYAKHDSRVVVIHKQNGGLSDARNAGIDIARGAYIGFVDSDDYIAPDMYETLYRDIQNEQADMSVCGVYKVRGEKIIPFFCSNDYFVVDGKKAFEVVMQMKIASITVWNKLYRINLFDDLRYPVGRLSEDVFIIADLLFKANKVVFHIVPQYYYRIQPNSISNSGFSPRLERDRADAYIHIQELVKIYCPEAQAVLDYRLWLSDRYFISMLSTQPQSVRNEYRSSIRGIKVKFARNLRKIFVNPYNSLKEKIMYVIIAVSPAMFMFIRKIYDRKQNKKDG